MSKPNATAAPIPVGILVCSTTHRAKVEKRTPTLMPPARRNPWLWMVSAGSVIYSALILAIGLLVHRPEAPAVCKSVTPVAAIEASVPAPIAPFPEPDLEPTPVERPTPLPMPVFVRVIDPPPLLPVEEAVVPEPVKPILAPAKPKSAWNQANPKVYASCEQIGTNILFVKNPVEAFKMAKNEKKLVFMVHLSGNLEDKEFT